MRLPSNLDECLAIHFGWFALDVNRTLVEVKDWYVGKIVKESEVEMIRNFYY